MGVYPQRYVRCFKRVSGGLGNFRERMPRDAPNHKQRNHQQGIGAGGEDERKRKTKPPYAKNTGGLPSAYSLPAVSKLSFVALCLSFKTIAGTEVQTDIVRCVIDGTDAKSAHAFMRANAKRKAE